MRAESVVRASDEGHRVVVESVRPSWPVRVVATHSFAPDGDGCTYTWAVEVVPAGQLGRVVARPLLRSLAANARAQQSRFRTEVVRWPR